MLTRLRLEDSLAGEMVALMYVPKHKRPEDEEEDDEEDMDVVDDGEEGGESGQDRRFRLAPAANRARSVDELQQRLKAKMDELRGNRGEGRKGKKSKGKPLTMEERRAKIREARKLKKKLSRAGGGKSNGGNKNKKPAVATANGSKPILNAGGKVVFSKFDFSEENGATATTDWENKKKKGPGGGGAATDAKAALAKLQKEKERIKSLEAAGRKHTLEIS